MDSFISTVIYGSMLSIIGGIGYIIKAYLNKINKLESKVDQAISKEDVRELLADKLDPIKEDVTEIKTQVQSLTTTIWTVVSKVNHE